MSATEPFTSPTNEGVNMDTPATEISTAVPRPRTRWAAVVWGLFFLATAVTALWIIVDDDRREVAGSWIGGLNPWSAGAYLGLAIGVLLLVGGIAGLTRRAQREHSGRAGDAAAEL